MFEFYFNKICIILGQLYGLEKFWAFRKYYKGAEKLNVNKKLNEALGKFKKIEDFHVDKSK